MFDKLNKSTKGNIAFQLRKYNIPYGSKTIRVRRGDNKTVSCKVRDIRKHHIEQLLQCIKDDDYIIKSKRGCNMDFWFLKKQSIKKYEKILKEWID